MDLLTPFKTYLSSADHVEFRCYDTKLVEGTINHLFLFRISCTDPPKVWQYAK